MKKILLSLVMLLITITTFAQAPDLINYQAIIRNDSGNLVQDSNVGIRVSILQTNATGTAVYTETHTASTNTNGLVTIMIGGGTTSDDFSTIDWSTGPYFIKTETDITGGTNYTITGTSQLVSVPYALHAKTASSISSQNNEVSDIQVSSTNIVPVSNYLVFDAFDAIVYVYNSTTGVWSSQTINPSVSQTSVLSSNGNFLVFDDFDNIVYAYSNATGTWFSQTINPSVSQASVFISEGNFLVFDDFDDIVYAFSGKTGTWSPQTMNSSVSQASVVVSNGNFLVFDDFDNVVYGYGNSSGAWSPQSINASLSQGSVSSSNGNFLVFDNFDDIVYTFSNVAGTWSSQSINGSVSGSSVIISGN
ncbi:MAG: hypothetical protein AAF617_00805 [Bacteroidota bacterium]